MRDEQSNEHTKKEGKKVLRLESHKTTKKDEQIT
jgi:hypothetical protein